MPDLVSFVLPSLFIAAILALCIPRSISLPSRLLVFFAFAGVLFIGLPRLYHWHYITKPNQRDRAAQRQAVQSRIIQAGGWAALEQECRAFIEASPRHQDGPSGTWREVPTGYPALAALQPRKITVGVIQGGGAFVYMELFGMHSTGGRGTPFYYLAVLSRPVRDVAELNFNRWRLSHVTNLIYEIF